MGYISDSTITGQQAVSTPKLEPDKEGELMELQHKVRLKFNEVWGMIK